MIILVHKVHRETNVTLSIELNDVGASDSLGRSWEHTDPFGELEFFFFDQVGGCLVAVPCCSETLTADPPQRQWLSCIIIGLHERDLYPALLEAQASTSN